MEIKMSISNILPQIYGLGDSNPGVIYSKKDAEDFLKDNIKDNNIKALCEMLINLQKVEIQSLFTIEIRQRIHQSTTLFNAVQPNDAFVEVLKKYYNGEGHKATLCRVNLYDRILNALIFISVDPKDFNITTHSYDVYREHPRHRFSHIYRVMVGAALIAKKINEPRLGLLAFIAAYIHDLSRINDGTDPQHGRRAAQKQLPKLKENGLLSKYNITDEEYDIIAKVSTYHCEQIKETVSNDCFKACKILTDADALDRCRFTEPNSRLDIKKLHFGESKKCITPIEFLCKESVRQRKISEEIPFAEFIKVAQF